MAAVPRLCVSRRIDIFGLQYLQGNIVEWIYTPSRLHFYITYYVLEWNLFYEQGGN